MTGIQVILIGGVIMIFLYYIFRLRSALIDLAGISLFAIASVFFILFPQYTHSIAARLGVGRGADLLFYICILFFLFVILKLFARLRRLEKQLEEHVREAAKEKAVYLKNSTK